MKLKELLDRIYEGPLPKDFQDREIMTIQCDSRHVGKDSLFVALPGPNHHGADFIPEAIQRGAKVIVHNSGSLNLKVPEVCLLEVSNPKHVWKQIVKRFYGDPSQKVRTIGITGTNGKTTITYLLESIIKKAGKRCGVIGTVNHRLGEKVLTAKNTTPGLLENQIYLADLARQGIEYCAMEVSSHALEQGRVDLIDFAAAIFTNLTGDHLDYHKDMDHYFQAKALLFTGLSTPAQAIINLDDEYGLKLRGLTKGNPFTYGVKTKADVTASDIKLTQLGSTFTILYPAGKINIKTELIGLHNVYNILAACAACLSQNINVYAIQEGIEKLKSVPGRLEQVFCGQDFNVFVDYAHTEDALQNVLSSLKRVSRSRILLVFGCGGNRDKTKRPKMGRVAGQLADWSIITSDNPRNEDPEIIAEEIRQGFQNDHYKLVLDRKEAIKEALSLAKAGDIVLIAGKGHEDYQIFKDRTIHFDDREMVRDYFKCSPSRIS